MKQVEELIGALEDKYKISIDAFIELYQEGCPREDMAIRLQCPEWTIRTVANALNLRMAKKHRAHDHSYFLARFGEESEVHILAELEEVKEDLEQLSKDLVAKELALVKAKREISKYKKVLPVLPITSIIDEAVSYINNTPSVGYTFSPRVESNYSYHTQIVVLSDLHMEEAVSLKDVASNEYNWDIACQRLDKVFNELLNAHRGESTLIVAILGDMISGIIHDSLESTTKPTGEAVAELAKLLASYISGLTTVYDNIYVPCVHGNHGRISENKKSSGYGFNFEYLMYQIIKSLLANHHNVIVDISTTGLSHCFIGSDNKVIGFHHGDYFRFVGDVKFLRVKEAFRQATGEEPDIIIQGHTHQFLVEEMPRGGKYITNGSLIGVNGYTHTNGMLGKSWGQIIMSLLPSGDIENVRLVQ